MQILRSSLRFPHSTTFLNTVCFWCLCFVLRYCEGTYLNTTCPKWNRSMHPSHTMYTRPDWSPLSCAMTCASFPDKCKSYTFCPAAERCEMYLASVDDYPDDLVAAPGCVHYTVPVVDKSTTFRSVDKYVACNQYPFEYHTEDDYAFHYVFPQFNPLEAFFMIFSFRTTGTAYVGFSEQKGVPETNSYEIAMGTFGTRDVHVKKCQTCDSLIEVTRYDLVESTAYRHFFLMLYNGTMVLGQRNRYPLFVVHDPDPLVATWPAIATKGGWGEWVFHSMASLQLCKICSN